MKKFNVFLLVLCICGVFARAVFADDGEHEEPAPGGEDPNVNCAAGYGYDPEDGCIKCEPGWYSPGGASVCIKCGGGRYSSSAGSAGCSKCAPGTYAPRPSDDGDDVNITCRPCPNGQYVDTQGALECLACSGTAPYVSPDKTSCSECPPGNCCYGFQAYICRKGTYSSGGLACPASITQQVCTRDGGGTCSMHVIGGVRKGVCTACPDGKTTPGLGSVDMNEDCSIQSASRFVNGNGGSFSWPTDGSISEQEITSPNVHFAR